MPTTTEGPWYAKDPENDIEFEPIEGVAIDENRHHAACVWAEQAWSDYLWESCIDSKHPGPFPVVIRSPSGEIYEMEVSVDFEPTFNASMKAKGV